MSTDLKQRFINMNNFLPTTVEQFICDTGLDLSIDFLPSQYEQYKTNNDNALYCSPSVLTQVLIRLKPFFGITRFATYTTNPTKAVNTMHSFLTTFFDVCCIKPVTSTIEASPNAVVEVAYVTADYSNIDDIINTTKNAVVIENLNREGIIEKINNYKRNNVLSYYITEDTDNPVTSALVVYKNLAMFE